MKIDEIYNLSNYYLILSNKNERLIKLAQSVLEVGNPENAGKGIAEIIKFLIKRISPENRYNATNKLKTKILNLNEHEMFTKKTPNSAALGQSISFIKNVLNGHNPSFIRETLNFIVRNL